MSVFCRFLLVGLLVIGGIGPKSATFGANLSEDLISQLAGAAPQDQIPVLVFFADQLNVKQVQANYKLGAFTRQAAHSLLITELERFADEKQSSVRELLAQARTSGDVSLVESYWIANAMRVTATKSIIEQLAQRPDIEAIIPDVPPTALANPNQIETILASTTGSSPGLDAIGAREMWQMGYTGQGRLVASFDTGVDGTHPALASSWRGLTYPGQQSWFDPVYQNETPTWDPAMSDPGKHGTHTMGVMVGKNDATGDTTGVAFGAQWISARVVDIPGANYLQAFQWAADPDGNPNTIEDVPDALNNSWGFKQSVLDCSDVFWSVIDNLEALGTVVVFACGNEGPNSATIRNPANRATSPINTFSVGATDTLGEVVWISSSRGPSDCNGTSIKPEVVAPGQAVRTTTPWSGTSYYTLVSGTSFAAPHVAGAVALLRQYNPNASADEIKLALLNTATDIGTLGEDNSAGMGLINIPAALAALPPNDETNIYVKAVEHSPIQPGMTLEVRVTLRNSGLGVLGVSGTLANPESGLTIDEGSSVFGNLPLNATADNSADPFVVQFANNLVDGTQVAVDLLISGGGGAYQKTLRLYFTVGAGLVKSRYTHSSDSIQFTISNYGSYGLAPGSASNQGGVGFLFPKTGINNLYQCGLLIGNSALGVSDGITNEINSIDEDFSVAPGGNLTTTVNGILGDRETYSRFHDDLARRPLGITVEQRTASFVGALDANYVIMEYTIVNDNDTALNDLYVALYFDWDFPPNSGQDRAGYVADLGLGYMWRNNYLDYRGTAVLNPEGVSSYYIIPNSEMIYDGVSEAEKYQMLTYHDADTINILPDRSYSIATGPFNLAPGASDTAAFAIIGARTLSELKGYAQRAKSIYRQATPVEDDDLPLPSDFALAQNYPNPFNPMTQIEFALPRAGAVRLEVINTLGQTVATLLDADRPAGTHIVQWYGLDDSGNEVASGVYFYRLTTAQRTEVRKMMLLK